MERTAEMTSNVVQLFHSALARDLADVQFHLSRQDDLETFPFPILPVSNSALSTTSIKCREPFNGYQLMLLSGDIIGEYRDIPIEICDLRLERGLVCCLCADQALPRPERDVSQYRNYQKDVSS
jgi:hypothetical protein